MTIFFRADDMGWDHELFLRLARLFSQKGFKLNGAAIPVTCRQLGPKLDLSEFAGLLEIHSHGLAHLDHESAGKKSEFGPSRGDLEVARDLAESRRAVSEQFGSLYYPAFVPPWNRFHERFLPLLAEAGFKCLSRDGRPRSSAAGLAEVNVAVDLHTSKRPLPSAPEGLWSLVRELSAALPAVGIMLHHAKMRPEDFDFLAAFLDLLGAAGAQSAFLSELAPC